MQTIDERFLSLGVDDPSSVSERQLQLLDITDKEGWFEQALGREVSDARAELFVLLKGIATKVNQEKVIRNYKALQKYRKAPQVPAPKPEDTTISPQSGDVTIYCDGGCSPNPGASGSGVAIYRSGKVAELWYGLYEPMGTNNTAELGALYESLLIAKKERTAGNKTEIRCDSMYAINCIKTWAVGWERNGWTKKGGAIKNLEIIKKAYALYSTIKADVPLTHIKAHAGLEGNELADRMTVHARERKVKAFVQYEGVIDVQAILSMRSG